MVSSIAVKLIVEPSQLEPPDAYKATQIRHGREEEEEEFAVLGWSGEAAGWQS